MSWDAALLTGFVFGIANAAHCAGMCGVFAFRAATGGGAARVVLYLAGKTATYVFLGTLAGLLGEKVLRGATAWQAAAGVAAGLVMLASGLRMLRPPRAPSRLATAWARAVEPLFRGAGRAHETGGPFALGAVTGALPCGVTYVAALNAASLGNPLLGAASMAAFGAGTMPALLAVALAGRGALARVGPERLRLAGALAVVATGLVAIARSAPALVAGAGAPPCCN